MKFMVMLALTLPIYAYHNMAGCFAEVDEVPSQVSQD